MRRRLFFFTQGKRGLNVRGGNLRQLPEDIALEKKNFKSLNLEYEWGEDLEGSCFFEDAD